MSRLTHSEREQLKGDLLRLRQTLNEQLELGRGAAETVLLDQSKIGRLSRMDALQQQNMAQSHLHSARQRLRRVLNALARMESGDYGYCERCGEDIAAGRLRVQPETALCLDCQSSTEG